MPEDPSGAAGTWVRRRDVLWRWIIDGVVLLPPGVEHPFVVTGSGASLWGLLAEPHPIGEVVAELARLYDADPAIVLGDIAPLLEELAVRGGLERVP